jgi:hypothetical protein
LWDSLCDENLTAYGGLLPVGTLLEKLGFRQLVEETLTVKRQTRAMPAYQFILAMVLACYVGFFDSITCGLLQREPMLTGILSVSAAPAAVYLLAVSGLFALQRGRPTVGCAAVHATASMGSSQREIERGGSRLRLLNWRSTGQGFPVRARF